MAKVILVVFAIGFIAVAVHGAAIPAEFQEAGKIARAECIAETGATVDMIEKAANGEFSDDGNLKCYLKCIFDKFTLIDGDQIRFDAMIEMVPPAMKEKTTKAIQKCREQTGKDLCEQSYNFSKCLYEENPEDFFVV